MEANPYFTNNPEGLYLVLGEGGYIISSGER